MADMSGYDWKAIDSDPKFQELHRKKTTFLWGLMFFSVLFYFMLPIGRVKVFGPVNFGILFALSDFFVAWAIAFIYARRANADFDTAAAEIVREAELKYGGRK